MTALLLAFVAHAAENHPVKIGTYGAWHAYRAEEKNQTVCFMTAKPQKLQLFKTRQAPQFTITHRPGENSLGVVHMDGGFPYLQKSDVTLTIGTEKFRLFTHGRNAWARDAVTDRQITTAMRKTKGNLTVRARTRKKTVITDTYSLAGVSGAWNKIGQACGVGTD